MLSKVKIFTRAFREAKHTASIRLQSTIDIDGLQNEPAGPIMLTEVPGPKSLDMITQMDKIQVNSLFIFHTNFTSNLI
jgi:hypothetical protein